MDNQIGIIITGTNDSTAAFTRLKTDLDAVAVSAKAVTETQKAMATAGRAATTENRALSSSVKASNTAFRRNAVAVRSSRNAISRWSTQANKAARAGERYRESAELAAVALGLAARNTTNLVKAQIQGAANLERLLIGLDAITGSLDAANAQYRDLIQVSRLPGINIENSLRATLQLQALGKTGEESTRIIRGFGNALALSGRSPRELGQVINAIRQMSGEGKILQEDIAIITTRIASLIPLMQEAFGGTRAEDVRKFYDALGTPPSQQAQLFLEVMLEGLERLPRAGETAANAIENLGDTAGRVQARIGSNFLPLVKEATAAIEGALMSIEQSPTAARNIASLEAFAGGLLGITAAAAALQASIKFLGPSLLAFATGPVGIAAVAAGAAAGAYLAWEVNLTSATEAQLKSLETEKTRLQLFREVQGLIAADDTARLATREDALSKSVAAANKAYEDQALVVSEARKALADYTRQTEQLRSSQGAKSARGAERTALTLRDPSELEGGLRQAEARLNALNRARLAANRIAVDAASLVEGARSAVVTPSDTLDQQIDALAQSATEGSTAIARALQQIQNIDANTGEAGLKREQDIALDIGDQLVGIAEATTVKQLDAAKKRVAGLARDNSLIVENETGLQNLLLAAESQFRDRKIALITAAGKEAISERVRQEIEAEREASAQGLIERQRSAQRAREQARRATTQLLTQSNEQISGVLNQLRDADVSGDQFASLNVQFETLVTNLDNLGVAVPNIGRLREELAGIANLRIDDQLSGLAEVTQRNQEAAFSGAREEGQQLTRKLLEGGEAVQREFARKRVQATRRVVREIERIETGFTRAQSVSSLERLQTDTKQLRTELQERGQAWQAHTDRVTALSRDISDSLDEALRTERLEKFQDAVANVVSDLAQTGFDFIFDSIFDRSRQATDAIGTFTDNVRGDIQLLESDIRRITRFGEDRALGASRLQEDRSRAERQLRFRLREAAGSQPFGDQRGIQRNVERQQDIRFQLRDRLEDFDVRIERFGQDTALRQSRLIEDATSNRERAESPRDQQGFLEQLGRKITDAISQSLSDKIGNAVASALAGALSNPFSSLIDTIKGLFGGGGGTGDGDGGATPSIGSIPSLTAPTESLSALTHSTPTLTAPTTSLLVLTHSTPTLTAPATSLLALTHSTPTLTPPLTSLAVLTHSTPTLTAPLESLFVRTHSTPTIGAIPAVSIPAEAITPVLTAIDTVTIPANAITPVVNPVTAIDIPSNAITPSVNAVTAIDIPANAITPAVNPVTAIDIPSNAIAPSVNAVNPITIPANAIDPTVNAVTAINIPSNAITPVVNPATAIDIPSNAITPSVNPVTAIDIPANAISPVINPALPINLSANPITPTINTPETIDLSSAGVILPAILSQLLKGGGEEDGDATVRTSERLQQITDRAPGEGVGDVVAGGEGNSGGFLNALDSLKESINSSIESGLSALPDGIEGLTRAILGTGIGVGGDGVSLGAAGGGLTDEQVESLAASLGEDLDSSFRSDFIPTLLGNQPGTVQPGDPDPDEDTVARAPAAPRFNQATAAGVSAVADVLSLEALANVAQESTLSNIASSLGSIQIATEKTAAAPVVAALRESGVEFPFSATSPTPDAAGIQAVSDAGLNASGLALFAQLDSIADQSETVKGLESLHELLSMPLQLEAGTLENPLYIKTDDILQVELVDKSVDATIVNTEPIPVNPGTVTVIVGNTPLTVNISDLSVLLSQLSQENTASQSFGGQTI